MRIPYRDDDVPPLLASLEWAEAGERLLRLRDTGDPTGSVVEYEIDEQGKPVVSHADRPRIVGKRVIPTPWSASGSEFREWEGLRLATRMEASWHLPEGMFAYYRAEVIPFALDGN